MESLRQNPMHISLEQMDVYLSSCFFASLTDRPPRVHTHPSFELVCVETDAGMEFVITPPLVEHLAVVAPPQNTCSMLFSFPQSNVKGICSHLCQLRKQITIPDTFDGAARIRSIRACVSDTRPSAREQIAAELRLFFVCLARTIEPAESDGSNGVQTVQEERIALLENYFNIRLKDPNCSKKDLAAHIGVSERQLTRILEETYHSSFSAILLDSRMSLAEALLASGVYSVCEVAERVGYGSVANFQRVYRKYFGVTPKANTAK